MFILIFKTMTKNEKSYDVKCEFTLLSWIAFIAHGSQKKADKLFYLAVRRADQILNSPCTYYRGVEICEINPENKFGWIQFVLSIVKPICKKYNMDYNKIKGSYLKANNC